MAKTSARITVRDVGLKAGLRTQKRLRTIARLSKVVQEARLQVGVFGPNADKDRDGTTNVELAAIHEYGAPNVPARSFLRSTLLRREAEIKAMFRRIGAGAIEGKITLDQGYEVMGNYLVAEVQQTIRGGISPALKPATIKRKNASVGGEGPSTPLIHTGQLINSISWEVVKKK